MLGVNHSRLSKLFTAATKTHRVRDENFKEMPGKQRKWPFRSLQKTDGKIKALLLNAEGLVIDKADLSVLMRDPEPLLDEQAPEKLNASKECLEELHRMLIFRKHLVREVYVEIPASDMHSDAFSRSETNADDDDDDGDE